MDRLTSLILLMATLFTVIPESVSAKDRFVLRSKSSNKVLFKGKLLESHAGLKFSLEGDAADGAQLVLTDENGQEVVATVKNGSVELPKVSSGSFEVDLKSSCSGCDLVLEQVNLGGGHSISVDKPLSGPRKQKTDSQKVARVEKGAPAANKATTSRFGKFRNLRSGSQVKR